MTARVYRDPAPDAPREPVTGVRERAQLAREEVAELAQLAREEVAELVAVRALLCELRPGESRDPTGPLAWSPMAAPPSHEEPAQGALARRIRVQQSADPSPVPRDAFASIAPLASGAEVAASIREVALSGGEEPAAVLLWLQRNGTLHQGLPALCVAVSVLAPEATRTRWAARKAALCAEARRQWGLAAVLYAARWWRGERPVCVQWQRDCDACGARTGGTITGLMSRCTRPTTVRVRGPRCGGR